MDLENFDIETVSSSPPTSLDTFLSSDDALDLLDNQWYNRVTRRARWMDLISDYAGSEPFVIDGKLLMNLSSLKELTTHPFRRISVPICVR